MMNNELFDAIKILINSSNGSDVKKIYNCLVQKNPDMMQEIAFSTLKGSKNIYGGVGTCKSFLPIGIYIEGWLLPVNNYDIIEIYCGEKFLGTAVLGLPRMDVYNNFKFFNEKEAGFRFFTTKGTKEIIEKHPLVIVVKKNGKVIKKIILNIDNFSVNDSIAEIKKTEEEKYNILIPTMSNRIPMILKIAECMPEYNFIILVEGMEENIEQTKKNCQVKYKLLSQELERLSMHMLPKLFIRNSFPGYSEVVLEKEEKDLYKEKEYIREASAIIREKYNVSLEYSIKYCCALNDYTEQLLNITKPKCVLLWNKYSPWHLVRDFVCKEYGVPVIYMESGVLPGTFIFETKGQMGESYPATNYEEFDRLSVTSGEIEEAVQIKKSLFESRINRWISVDPSVYNQGEKEKVLEQLNPNRPTIFYAGQNDFDSGLFPYTEHTKRYHSPVFESSNEAAIYLSKIAAKNNWNLIYKRHPMMRGKMNIDFPKGVILNDTIDIHDAIDISDLTITILSQTSYVALLRDKPALMLGYHQLCHKGCIYEAWEKSEIEKCIIQALEKGFSEKQRENFNRHIAQMCKYYLYTDFVDHTISFGKSLNDLTKYLKKIIENGSGVNYELECKGEPSIADEPIVHDLQDRREEQISMFKFDLSFQERIQRKKVKQLLAGKSVLGFKKKEADILTCLTDVQTQEHFDRIMMYLAQIDNQYLQDNDWSELFVELFLRFLKVGEDCFIEFLEKCNCLYDEIKMRLDIQAGIERGYKKAFLQRSTRKEILRICACGKDKDFQIKCILKLGTYLVNLEEDEIQEVIGSIEEVINEADVTASGKNYLLKVLYKCSLFYDKQMKLWNRILLETDNADLLYYFGVVELDRIAFTHPEYIYQEYYTDRKRLLVHISEVLTEGIIFEKRAAEKNNHRIAMLVVGLQGKLYASTRLQIGLANEMARRGYQVTIFVADTNYITAENDFILQPDTVRFNFSKKIYQEDHLMMTHLNVDIKYFTNETTGKDRYCEFLDAVYQYNPLAVIDITNENAVYNPQLIKDFPVITVPLNGYNSSSVYSAYIARNINLVKQCNEKYQSIKTKYIYEANMYIPLEIEEKTYSRKNYGLKEQDFVVVTVGNRLDFELTEEVQRGMKELLDCNQNMKWILVGTIKSELKILKAEQDRRQIIKWGYEKKLSCLYKMCDIYLDPPRSGGAGSVAYAVQVGLPALIVNMPSDILPYIGEENSMADWKEELKALLEAMKNKVYCKKLIIKQQKKLKSDEWSIIHFGEIVEEAINELTKKGEK